MQDVVHGLRFLHGEGRRTFRTPPSWSRGFFLLPRYFLRVVNIERLRREGRKERAAGERRRNWRGDSGRLRCFLQEAEAGSSVPLSFSPSSLFPLRRSSTKKERIWNMDIRESPTYCAPSFYFITLASPLNQARDLAVYVPFLVPALDGESAERGRVRKIEGSERSDKRKAADEVE